ncbi:MAG: TonB-dependent receptor [Flavobacteriales bacterium]
MHHSRIAFLVVSFFLFISIPSFSQEKFTVSGYVKDGATGEYMMAANVYVIETQKGTTTNGYGFYSITLPKGKYKLKFSFIGYQDLTKDVELNGNTTLNVQLNPDSYQIDEIEVVADGAKENTNSTDMGRVGLDVEKIKTLPAFMGEVDIMKTIQLLPGVQAAGEGNSGFYVRGGGPDQNLILLDEAVVYNASHLFGFFSVFNADAVRNVELYKGSMPANFGGRLASVVEVSMKEGNSKEVKVDGGIGLISSRLTVQGPIKKDTSSFMISGRRTYIDVLMKPFIKESSPFRGTGYYFYDLNAKFNYRFNDKDRLFFSGYFGKDVFDFGNKDAGFGVRIPWGNATATVRWNHLFNSKLFMNVSAIYSKYDFQFAASQDDFEFAIFSGIQDWNGKLDFFYLPNPRHNIKFGSFYTYHTFIPSSATARQGDLEFDTGDRVKLFAHEAAVYFNDDFDLTEEIRISAGLRYSAFNQVGPFKRYVKDPTLGTTIDTIHYSSGESVKLYHGPEPRLSMRYTLNKVSSLKAAYTRNLQFIHLASLSAVSLPTDVWVPSTDRVNPQIGNQYSIGYFRNLKKDAYETSVEVYYKTMQNQVEYREGAQPDDDVKDNPDNNFVFGYGWAYGAEFFLKKRSGKFNGWVGYTLSWTKRRFDDLNSGEWFYAKFDRRNDVSLALVYEPNKKWTFGAVFVYAQGNAITLPYSWYMVQDQVVFEFAPRNSLRMPAYHRLDLSATRKGKETKKFKSSWNFSIYNVYSRLNPYFLYVDISGSPIDGTLTIKAKQVSLFPILPSVTWNFSF